MVWRVNRTLLTFHEWPPVKIIVGSLNRCLHQLHLHDSIVHKIDFWRTIKAAEAMIFNSIWNGHRSLVWRSHLCGLESKRVICIFDTRIPGLADRVSHCACCRNPGALRRPLVWRTLTLHQSCVEVILDSRHEEDVHQGICGAAYVEEGDSQDLGHLVVHRDRKDGRNDGGKPTDYPRDDDHGRNNQQTSGLCSRFYHSEWICK